MKVNGLDDTWRVQVNCNEAGYLLAPSQHIHEGLP